ncbi:MAG: hypothetical protein GWN86_04015 [Desulfobacterales bacterium]|nr:hypothetical protein [Desulfobacterales bacterium]
MSYDEEMYQIKEYIELAGEYALAYETIVSTLEVHPFVLSGRSSVNLLEVGLIMGFKTEKENDNIYDLRGK